MASVSIPMAKVRMGLPSFLAAMEHTSEESSPPESRKPTGASASSRFSTPAISFSRMFCRMVGISSCMGAGTSAMSS